MLEQLYSRYKEDVYRYLLSLCRDPLLAEDLLSETFLEALRGDRVRDVVSRRVEGWSFAEIAKRWRISESSARVIDFRARKWLREVLEKEGLR